jgi:hypothetical protein
MIICPRRALGRAPTAHRIQKRGPQNNAAKPLPPIESSSTRTTEIEAPQLTTPLVPH